MNEREEYPAHFFINKSNYYFVCLQKKIKFASLLKKVNSRKLITL